MQYHSQYKPLPIYCPVSISAIAESMVFRILNKVRGTSLIQYKVFVSFFDFFNPVSEATDFANSYSHILFALSTFMRYLSPLIMFSLDSPAIRAIKLQAKPTTFHFLSFQKNSIRRSVVVRSSVGC